jgi:hypothetical protein
MRQNPNSNWSKWKYEVRKVSTYEVLRTSDYRYSSLQAAQKAALLSARYHADRAMKDAVELVKEAAALFAMGGGYD